ncbi:MAG: DNA recombination protein RmuC [Candidatus Cloacimonadaceae bacterium]|jgi:DNA recombination protein RmuC|nr:DNA recombination protein RmuC [Candidatus Cloacimonadota bacterium]MDY0127796.1 DNA recombination protein RmuC [Candidatus Cloacimonadaceae bacterium]MCB5254338.1 DNA recombination protein RmuC [Candidatus Cloacimonadota bacterium]MCK9177925.1 DNA recombination protein RmuC [Candidatus Cloacimonadota bacterium]MCK9242506.1 DNA recombination protein RmuC [Candidatus Cloacimonadota bacterium]
MEPIFIALLIAILALLIVLLFRRRSESSPEELLRLKTELEMLSRTIKDEVNGLRAEVLSQNQVNREELSRTLKDSSESQFKQASETRMEISNTLNALNKQMIADSALSRQELTKAQNNLSESLSRKLSELTTGSSEQTEKLKKSIEERLEQIRSGNEIKLEEMRKTVDEKLHATLEKRLGESFNQVSQRLEEVHKGLGEMRSLASDVGGLKKALEGVKPRGILGELQLETLLDEILTSEQYVKNFKPNSRRDEVVEFAVVLPGKDDLDSRVYLPIDAKFPIEDYYSLVDAFETGDRAAIASSQKAIANRIKSSARDIRDKYLNPPVTTDFAILFLPFESLYAEVLRIPGLFEMVMREYSIILCGPTTAAALLNSLQVGFRTMAIQKKSSEVWKVLAAVKKDFGLFGDVLLNTRKKIEGVGRELDKAHHRSRQIEKKLGRMENLPEPEAVPKELIVDEPIEPTES